MISSFIIAQTLVRTNFITAKTLVRTYSQLHIYYTCCYIIQGQLNLERVQNLFLTQKGQLSSQNPRGLPRYRASKTHLWNITRKERKLCMRASKASSNFVYSERCIQSKHITGGNLKIVLLLLLLLKWFCLSRITTPHFLSFFFFCAWAILHLNELKRDLCNNQWYSPPPTTPPGSCKCHPKMFL